MSLKFMGFKFLVILMVAAVLVGCSSTPTTTPTIVPPTALPQPTQNVQPTIFAAQTQAVQTYVANQILNAPTATRVPPTATLAATAVGTAILPTSALATPVKATATTPPTATQKPAANPTPVIACSVRSVSPSTADIVAPGSQFTVRWVVINTGGTTWTTQYALAYWSGMRFEMQKSQNLPFDVARNDDITLTATLKAPGNPGTYNTTWAIWNGYTPTCLMSLSVVVK
jgi:hypothetical protein